MKGKREVRELYGAGSLSVEGPNTKSSNYRLCKGWGSADFLLCALELDFLFYFDCLSEAGFSEPS